MNKERLLPLVRQVQFPSLILVNLLITAAGFFVAYGIRFDFMLEGLVTFDILMVPLCALVLFKASAYALFDLYKAPWRHVSTFEAVNFFKAHLLASLCFATSLLIYKPKGFPRSVVVIEFCFSLLFALGARVFVRLLAERHSAGRTKDALEYREVVVIGAGDSARLLVKTLNSQQRLGYRPTVLFDDNKFLKGSSVYGLKVVGPLSFLEDYLRQHPHIALVIIAIPSLSSVKVQEIKEICDSFHLPLRHVQTFEELACRDSLEPRTRITIEEALNREVQIHHETEIQSQIQGRCVLVTGAGGSIGSELCRQILSFQPSKLILLDKSEYNLFSIEGELRGYPGSVQSVYSLSNIVNKHRLMALFERHQPEIVFHAAAYKHVPLLEANCYEGFLNNIIGTKNLLECAQTIGTERFVLISTDKAVDPSSVMGCTKRVAELMVRATSISNVIDLRTRQEHTRMSTAVVRFGNVINSSGSVIPLFKRQILEGRPITVTHPEMSRYFMSIREAVRLVLTAGTLGDQGEIYLLDMGKPIKIVEVARKLMALYGKRDLQIVYTGLREGEKLTEQLYSENEIREASKFNKVFTVRPKVQVQEDVFSWVSTFASRLDEASEEEIAMALRAFVFSHETTMTDVGSVVQPMSANTAVKLV